MWARQPLATIYEQRKTNEILVAGFTNLQITASIDDLAGSVDVMTSTLNESMRAIRSRMGDIGDFLVNGTKNKAGRIR